MDSDRKNALSILGVVVTLVLVSGVFANVSLVKRPTDYSSSAASPPPKLLCNSLNLTPSSGTAPLTVTATISATASRGEKITGYVFNFGDGTGNFQQTRPSITRDFQNPGTFTVKGYVVGKLSGQVGGTGNCQKTVTVNQSGGITVDKTRVEVYLSRADAQYGLVYGPGFTITSLGAIGWQIHYNEPTQGQGFYDSSGGIIPGSSYDVRTYINTNKSNGVYTGSAVVEYWYNDNIFQKGPTVYYTITLTD